MASGMTAKQLIEHLTEGLKTLGVQDCPIIVWDRANEQAGWVQIEKMIPDKTFSEDGFCNDPSSIHLGFRA